MQREDVLGEALKLLELQGIANTTLEMVAERVDYPLDELRRFWPDKEAILYDALRYLSQQIDVWRRQLMLDETQTAEQKLLARYQALSECVKNNRYPGCLFIAACTFYPDPGHLPHTPSTGIVRLVGPGQPLNQFAVLMACNFKKIRL